jgi:3-dehydroquinate dehydratase-2
MEHVRMSRVLVINGPNLNLLGTREPHIYGATTLADVEHSLRTQAQTLGVELDCFQSNHEGAIVDRIHEAQREGVSFAIINPGAYTHTSVAIRDAFGGVAIPFVEVHISNVHKREPFRHHSYLSDIAEAVMAGFGAMGYNLALQFVASKLR